MKNLILNIKNLTITLNTNLVNMVNTLCIRTNDLGYNNLRFSYL